jgi:hypothetical protein
MRRLVFALATLLAPAAAAADATRPPAFALAGPYGDPFALAVRRGLPLPQELMGIAAEPRGEKNGRALAQDRITPPAGGSGTAAKRKDEDDDDDEDDDPVPAKPGSFPTTFMKVPDPVPNVKKRSMGPHLRPDAEFALDDKTTFGIISQLDRLHTSAAQTILGKSAAPTVSTRTLPGATSHGRDLGFGASLEFKLGQ